ncbi:MAG TPA: polysaccharide deacetylase family protein [Steroidobacter sp.]|jgi:peptidoglycan/xylan/chitin deacetylase (PgdA/CDA1 family)|nr:polysaccharide deacetylase family protein [Steroidobacteraceae bacterium]HLS80812.1 polysaccharide deacetylase family protein [Steroidobacter sp.]
MEPIYLTFDDGPDPQWTPRILDALAKAQACATFFVIGRQVRAQAALVRRIASEGHVLGNHTFSHRHPWLMRRSDARNEVRDGARALSDVLGRPVGLFRPPHGRLRACMADEARREGQRIVMWNRSAVDWGVLGRASGIARRLARASAHDIVLMHDGRNRHNRPEQLLQALPGFLRSLSQSGLKPVAPPLEPTGR